MMALYYHIRGYIFFREIRHDCVLCDAIELYTANAGTDDGDRGTTRASLSLSFATWGAGVAAGGCAKNTCIILVAEVPYCQPCMHQYRSTYGGGRGTIV